MEMFCVILSLFLLLGVLLTLPSIVKNERYFIVSSPEQCDSLDEGYCLTLSSLATKLNTSNYFQLSSYITELILCQGNHALYLRFAIASVNQLWFYSNTSHSLDTNIVCIDRTARFEFTNITHIHIFNIKFLGCGGNRADSVMDFTLINTIFDGQQKKDLGTALELVNSSLKAERTSFVSNVIGGAVIVSESTATFLNCKFEGNHAELGGAIYGNLSSNISIANSTFDHNSAAKYGGAIYTGTLAIENYDNDIRYGVLSIQASNFSNNKAEQYGGGVAVFRVNMSTHESRFTNNVAKSSGGALFSGIVNISGTDFSGNNATNYCGGAVHMNNTMVLIFNSTFNQNSNHYGGALCLLWSINYLHDCTFRFNEAARLGGAIYTQNS